MFRGKKPEKNLLTERNYRCSDGTDNLPNWWIWGSYELLTDEA